MEMTEDREDTAASGEEADRPSSAKSKDKDKDRKIRNKPFTKIILRRLPPSMTEESFLEQVSPIPEHDYFYFARPDPSLLHCGFSRAYINFVNMEDIYLFKDKFDGYVFLDDKGLEYVCIVEYAPFQRVPKKRRKKDPKSGTIESDPDYEKFLESLKEPEGESREPKLEYSYPLTDNNDKKSTSTPLLEFLASRKLDKRNREERRRREADKRKVRIDRKTKEATIQEEENPDGEVKQIKARDWEKEKNSPKTKEEDSNKSGVKSSKSYRDQRRLSDEKKKFEGEKKENRSKEYDSDKSIRKEKKDKIRDSPREVKDKSKEVKKYSEARKDRFKYDKKEDWSEKSDTSEIEKTERRPKIRDSDIKPFTQLPPVKTDDLTKVIEEMDRLMKLEEESKESKSGHTKASDTNKTTKPETVVDADEPSSRRKSLESNASNKDDDRERSKSTDRENSLEKDKTSGGGDPRTERRIRNKDRPSMVIYQPGMGKFSKQRISKDKDGQSGTELEVQDKKDT